MYTILHLETGTLNRTFIREITAEINAIYFSASDIDEAIDIIKCENISLILTSMELEGGSAVDFIKSLNDSDYSCIPVVVFTENDSLDERRRMYELGIIDYIHKTAGRDIVRQNLAAYSEYDKIDAMMRTLNYAVIGKNRSDRSVIGRIFSMHNICNVEFFDEEESVFDCGKKYDVYIVDIIHKDIPEGEFVLRLREQNPGSVVMAISGIDNIRLVSRVLSIGADDYIIRPFNCSLFMASIKTNIRSYLFLQESMRKTEQLERMAATDYLTGLYNSMHAYERLTQEVEKAGRYKSKFSMFLLNIDYFRRINDSLGRRSGDMLLVKVADVIRSSIRNVDIAGRYGGEEFIVILPELSLEGAVTVAERIRSRISEIKTETDNFPLTVSGGAAEYPGGNVHEFLKKAENLLCAAKEGGRNRICY